jgi:5-methylcytosine-specific restriction enzyme subunit McrC
VDIQDFDWLVAESDRLRAGKGARLVQLDGRTDLCLDNYVGVIETPFGTRIEVLPKVTPDFDESTTATARDLLQTMLSQCLDLEPRTSQETALRTYDYPLTEWIAARFLASVDHLVKRGLRFEYRAMQEELRFLRGRLQVAQQLRQPPGRAHHFQVEHDVYDPDRAENRLIRLALDKIRKRTREPRNWRLAHELAHQLIEIPASTQVREDFRRWRKDRLMAHYAPVRPWCSLILNEEMPLSVVGLQEGQSLLFPMEKVFEQYVGLSLRGWVPEGSRVVCQATRHSLCTHLDRPWFQMRPDFLVVRGQVAVMVIDAKWKLLDSRRNDSEYQYGLSQADFYQLYAYGQKHLSGQGRLILLYPMTAKFDRALAPFHFHDGLTLHVMPVDLAKGVVVGEFPPESS